MFLHKDLSKIMLQFNYVFNTFMFKVTLASPLSSTYFLIFFLSLDLDFILPVYVFVLYFYIIHAFIHSMWTYFVLPVSVLLFYDLLPYWCMRPYVVLSL